MVDLGVVNALIPLLKSPKKSIRKETAWTMSNITAGTPEQLNAMIQSTAFADIINVINHDDIEVKKEAIWAICNAVSIGSPETIAHLVNLGAIEAVCTLLDGKDSRTLVVTMEGIRYILKAG
jgi:hypothetical protein